VVAAGVLLAGRAPGTGPPAPTPDAARSGRVAPTNLPIPQQASGSWAGAIHQKNPALDVTVRLSLPGGSRHGTLAYPQLGCTGRLGLTSAKPAMLTFRLTITSGRNNCSNG